MPPRSVTSSSRASLPTSKRKVCCSSSATGRDPSAGRAADDPARAPVPLTEVPSADVGRTSTGFAEFDRVLGGGLVAGAVALALVALPRLGANTNYVEFFKPGNEVREGYRQLAELGLPQSSIDIAVALPEGSRFADLELVVEGTEDREPDLAVVEVFAEVFELALAGFVVRRVRR